MYNKITVITVLIEKLLEIMRLREYVFDEKIDDASRGIFEA
jgi:hypothetical protein